MFSSRKVKIFGTHFHNISFQELCDGIEAAKRQGQSLTMMSLNLDILTKLHKLEEFKDAANNFSLILIDSTPLMKLIEREGIKVSEKLAGSDLMPRICSFASENHLKCCIVGGAEGVAALAAERLKESNPGLEFVGTLSPKFGFTENTALSKETAGEIASLDPDIVFICLGAPKAELFISRYLSNLGIPAIFSVGAAVDFTAGTKVRAPKWVQRIGFEWLFRFLQEPKRLFRRYFIESWMFLKIYNQYKHQDS